MKALKDYLLYDKSIDNKNFKNITPVKKYYEKKNTQLDNINIIEDNETCRDNNLNKSNQFCVKCLPNGRDDLAYLNCMFHNKKDFNEKTELYLKINNTTVYKSVHRDDVAQKTIEMSSVLRRVYGIKSSDIEISDIEIYVEEISDLQYSNILDFLKVKIYVYNKSNDIIYLHEEELRDFIKEKLQNHLFFAKQKLIFKYQNENILLEVTKNTGKINNCTEIDIQTNDAKLNIIGSKLLKRDLFKPDYNFENIGIGGMDTNLIEIFKSALCTRAFSQNTIDKIGIKHVKGILLYGPPGTGKTLIAVKIGSMISNIKPKVVSGPELLNKYVGQSEENIRNLFKDAIDDTDNVNLHVIIFDEIDAICKKRGREGTGANVNDNIVNQLLSLIEGVHALNNIFIIAMTNRKELLDPALLRAGRIEIHMQIGLPNIEGRKQVFRIHTEKMSKSNMVAEIDYDYLAINSENYSGAEIESVVKRASASALHELLSSNKNKISDQDININMKHFREALENVQPLFGKNIKKIKSIMPDNYSMNYNNDYSTKLDELLNLFNNKYNFQKYLILGNTGCGKTTLVADLALRASIKNTKLIRVIDMITLDEISKANYVSDIILESYNTNDSLVIIDDIEIVINFAELFGSVTFSNRLYQVLLTILKSAPENKNNRLTLMVTCGNENLSKHIEGYFDKIFKLY